MKTLVCLLALALSSSLALAQDVIMKIRMKDGSEMRINTDSVRIMSANSTVSYPEFRMMHLSLTHNFYGVRDELDVNSTLMDSLRFVRTPDEVRFRLKNNNSFTVGSLKKGQFSIDMDTVRFGLYEQNPSVSRIGVDGEWPGQVAAVWHGTNIYATPPLEMYVVNDRFEFVRDSMMSEAAWSYNVEINDAGDRLAYSHSGLYYTGRLLEHNLLTGMVETLATDSMVTSAHYLPNSNNLIYYTLGSYDPVSDPNPDDAGYYLLDRSSGKTTFLMRHLAYDPQSEAVNSFDIRHDGKKLLFSKAGNYKKPLLLELDLQSLAPMDTLDVDFPKSYWSSLWVQYSNDDSRILYSLSSFGLGPSPVGATGEVGIIDRETLRKTILDVAPHNMRSFSTPFPRWSPDNTAICYGAAMIPFFVLDTIETSYVYVKKL